MAVRARTFATACLESVRRATVEILASRAHCARPFTCRSLRPAGLETTPGAICFARASCVCLSTWCTHVRMYACVRWACSPRHVPAEDPDPGQSKYFPAPQVTQAAGDPRRKPGGSLRRWRVGEGTRHSGMRQRTSVLHDLGIQPHRPRSNCPCTGRQNTLLKAPAKTTHAVCASTRGLPETHTHMRLTSEGARTKTRIAQPDVRAHPPWAPTPLPHARGATLHAQPPGFCAQASARTV